MLLDTELSLGESLEITGQRLPHTRFRVSDFRALGLCFCAVSMVPPRHIIEQQQAPKKLEEKGLGGFASLQAARVLSFCQVPFQQLLRWQRGHIGAAFTKHPAELGGD